MSLLSELKRRNVLRVAIAYLATAWLVIQIVGTLLPILPGEDPESIFRGIAVILVIGFPITLVFSWLYEYTPEGFKTEKYIDRSQPLARRTGKYLDRIIIIVLALAVAYFAIDKFLIDPARDAEREQEAVEQARTEALIGSYGDSSIAVLPFVNMSDDASNEYFSDGISEELLNLLAQIPKLRVISRSSSFAYKGKDIDVPAVAEKLNVSYVLEGSVRKAGNQVRITAQLIEARSDTHQWSDSYDRVLDDIFVVQDQIAAAIVHELKDKLDLNEKIIPHTIAAANSEAYDAYLRGRYLIVQRTPDAVAAARKEFQKAVTLDPDYAVAYAELSLAARLSARGMYGELSAQESRDQALPFAARALELNPNLAQAHAAMGYVRVHPDTIDLAIQHFRQAIELNPNYSEPRLWLGNFIAGMGNYREAFAMYEIAARLDPMSVPALNNYIDGLMVRGRFDAAELALDELGSISPEHHMLRSSFYDWWDGRWSDAVVTELQLRKRAPEFWFRNNQLAEKLAMLGLEAEVLASSEYRSPLTYSILRKPEEGIRAVNEMLVKRPDGVWETMALGLALAENGDFQRAQEPLENSWKRFRRTVTYGYFSIDAALALIAARQDAGQGDVTDELVAAIQDNVRRYREAGMTRGGIFWSVDYERGIVAYLAGDLAAAVELIAHAAGNGYYVRPAPVYLQALYDAPGFAEILARQEERRTQQRGLFLEAVCADNPYADVWSTQAGTCEKYLAYAQ